jgi:hypothetical protein
MNTLLVRWSAIALLLGLFTVLSSGCVVPGDGYGYNGDVGVGVDYYEPYGAFYGGWGPGYDVGPYRDGGHGPDRRGGQSSAHSYRSTPASHSMPSIPSRSRSGGSRSGGSRSH